MERPMQATVEQVMRRLEEAIKRNGGRSRIFEEEKPPSIQRLTKMLESDGFPRRHLDIAAKLVESDWMKPIRQRLIEQLCVGETVLLYGPTGAAKTLLAAVVGLELARKQKQVVYATMPDLMIELRDSFDRRRPINEVLTRYGKGILMLDEVGRWKGSETEQSVLWTLLDRRWRNYQGTLLVAEGEKGILNKLFPTAIRRRILESGGTVELSDDKESL